jgi:hypothetical protein
MSLAETHGLKMIWRRQRDLTSASYVPQSGTRLT